MLIAPLFRRLTRVARAFALAVSVPIALAASPAALAALAPMTVVEYYNSSLDHYFVTMNVDEQQKLDTGVLKGWARTGKTFLAYPPSSAVADVTSICRFYGKPEAGLDSHFYSASLAECDAVKSKFADTWVLEASNVFELFGVNPAGTCPAGTTPISRLYNKRSDVNHRYTTDKATYDAMIAKGYVPEGTALLAGGTAIFCSAVDPAYVPPTAPPVTVPPPSGGGAIPICTITPVSGTRSVGQTLTLNATCTNSPTFVSWTGCVDNGLSCTHAPSSAGTYTYSVRGSSSAGNGPSDSISVDWTGAVEFACTSLTLSPNTQNPVINNNLTLTLNCNAGNGSAISYTWQGVTNCSSTSKSCTQNQTTAGDQPITVTAVQNGVTSSPYSVTLKWQTPPPPPTCTLSSSSLAPNTYSSITLTASCPNATTYTWSGTPSGKCSSSSATCSFVETVEGSKTYSVAGTTPGSVPAGAGTPATVTVGWVVQPVQEPTNCTVTANPSSLPSSGGNVTLTASCSGRVTSYKWSKGGQSFGGSSSQQGDTLPANTTSTAVDTTYEMSACDDTTCIKTPKTVVVSVSGVATQSCRVYSTPWKNGNRVSTSGFKGSPIAFKLDIPATATVGDGNMSIAEYVGTTTWRETTISTSACDFGSRAMAYSSGNQISYIFSMAANGKYPLKLIPGTTYYVNVRNEYQGVSTCDTTSCDVAIDLRVP